MTYEAKETLFGFPVVVTDAMPTGEMAFGRWPTPDEIKQYGSFEKAVEAQAKEWAWLKGLPTE